MQSTSDLSTRAPIMASAAGRRLRLGLPGGGLEFLVDPLPGKCGLALTRAFLARVHGAAEGTPAECVFAEALGPDNYALLTGSCVQIFDADGRYVRTAMPDAVMIEPLSDVEPPIDGQRVRIVPAPSDGLAVRNEEVEMLALAALYWQSAAGSRALSAYLESGANIEGAVSAQALLEDALRRPAIIPGPPV